MSTRDVSGSDPVLLYLVNWVNGSIATKGCKQSRSDSDDPTAGISSSHCIDNGFSMHTHCIDKGS